VIGYVTTISAYVCNSTSPATDTSSTTTTYLRGDPTPSSHQPWSSATKHSSTNTHKSWVTNHQKPNEDLLYHGILLCPKRGSVRADSKTTAPELQAQSFHGQDHPDKHPVITRDLHVTYSLTICSPFML
jgi:hypothetical protein